MKDITKLPKWAQEHIEKLQRELDAAADRLQQLEDEQTESPIWTDDMVCDVRAERGPSFVRRFINGAHSVSFRHEGVSLRVLLRDGVGIEITWSGSEREFSMVDAAMIPYGYQSIRIVAKENMR